VIRGGRLVEQLEAREPLPIGALTRWYVAAGDHARALDLFARAFTERSGTMPLSLADPGLDPLRSHPRFQEILRIQRSTPRNRSTSS
jgi:hypothetical protein